MSVEIIQERLAKYACKSTLEEEQALREITQEIILAGLARTDYFGRAGFQGGTCLRIFHSLNRFSEDMDFALDTPDTTFQLSPYLDRGRQEVMAYGYELEIDDRSKAGTTVRKAFDAGPARRAAFRQTTRIAIIGALDARVLPSAMRQAQRVGPQIFTSRRFLNVIRHLRKTVPEAPERFDEPRNHDQEAPERPSETTREVRADFHHVPPLSVEFFLRQSSSQNAATF